MRRFIVGTDWWSDCDDAVAMRLLLSAHKRGEIEVAGIAIDACMKYSVASLDGFLCKEGVRDIPVGLDLEADDFGSLETYRARYQPTLAEYAENLKKNEDVGDALKLYRKILAESDGKVEIIEIGFAQVLAALLESEGDEFSPLSGFELVKNKVSKFWIMGGRWDAAGAKEHNFSKNARACRGAHIFCEKCPVPVTFLGFEIGYNVFTGGKLDDSDTLRRILLDFGAVRGRESWDPMLALMALIGDEEKAGYKTVRGRASVDAETGANHFEISENGNHVYVIKAKENSFYENMIDELITQ